MSGDKVLAEFRTHLLGNPGYDPGNCFPCLSILAKNFLAIPAISTPLESVFSVAGIVVDRKWYALITEMVDVLVFFTRTHICKDLLTMVPQAELLLLPKDQEVNEISDDEKTLDHDIVLLQMMLTL